MITGRSPRKDAIVALVLVFFAVRMSSDLPVPLLSYVDLGYHGLGRIIAFPFPELVRAVGGSFTQIAVPLCLAVYFFVRDEAATALLLGWAATDTLDVARHIADAPYGKLPPVFGMHEWSVFLGKLQLLGRAQEIADAVRFAGWTMLVVAFVVLALAYVRRIATGHEAPA